MVLYVFFKKLRVRAQRCRMIRQELKAFARISPELCSDIGLFPQGFRDQADELCSRIWR